MAAKTKPNPTNNGNRIRKRGEFFSFLVAAILIVGFFAASHYMFFGYTERKVASVPRFVNLECQNLLPLLNSGDSKIRFRATSALASCGYPSGIDGLIGFLDDRDSNLQKAAAFVLLSQELTLKDPALIAKIDQNREKINKLIHPALAK